MSCGMEGDDGKQFHGYTFAFQTRSVVKYLAASPSRNYIKTILHFTKYVLRETQ